jgi:branched-chain amino acid transport system permease protein
MSDCQLLASASVEIVQQGINALSLGSLYAVLALGLAIVFVTFGLVNFAYGELLTVAAYTFYLGYQIGAPFAATLPAAVLVAASTGVLMERLAFRPLRRASFVTLLFTSFAVSILIQSALRLTIGSMPKGVPLPELLTDVIKIGPYSIGWLPILTSATCFATLGALTIFLSRSTIGLSIVAAAHDFQLARLTGIRANRVIAGAFALSGLLAGLAALFFLARRGTADPGMGFVPLVKAFIACVLGGLGSLSGAVAGGFVLGALEVGLAASLPSELLPFADAITVGIVLLILYVRPEGILVSRGERRPRRFPLLRGLKLDRRRAVGVTRPAIYHGTLGLAVLGVPLALVALLGATVAGPADQRAIVNFLIMIILVMGIQSFSGNSGIISFAHASFMGIGAYTAGLAAIPLGIKAFTLVAAPEFIREHSVPGPAAILLAVVLTAATAGVVGAAVTRMDENAMVMATFGVLVIVNVVFINFDEITGGISGLYGIPQSISVWGALAGALVTLAVVRVFKESRSGLKLRASRADHLAAEVLGVHVVKLRFWAWTLSGAVMGLGGALWAQHNVAFTPVEFFVDPTITLLAALVVGGLGSVSGAVAGVTIVTAATELLSRVEAEINTTGLTQIGIAILILLVLYRRPDGVMGYSELDELLGRGAIRVHRAWRSRLDSGGEQPS